MQAALLPAEEALAWVEAHLREGKWKAHAQALQIWASMLPACKEAPPPPEPPED